MHISKLTLSTIIMTAVLAAGCGSTTNGPDVTGDTADDDVALDATDDGTPPVDAADDTTIPDSGDVATPEAIDDVTIPDADAFNYVPVDDAWAVDALPMDTNDKTDTFDLPDGLKIRVGSYNLYGYHWAAAQDFGNLVKELDPDLMGLVESNEDQLPALAAAAGYQHYCSNGDGRSLLSKTPLAPCETITLVGGRTLLRTETEIDGVTFAVYVMHIDWDVIGNQQTRDFIDNYFVDETRSHVVLMGDYNDEHLSRQMNILDEQLADAFTAYGWYPGERVTWPSQYFDDTEGSQTIDLIFFRKTMRPIVLEADAVNLSPCLSDHKPVWADMLFPRTETPWPDWMTMNRIDPLRVFWHTPENAPPNLVQNPGAESGLDGWTVTGGGVSTESRLACLPSSGEKFFAGLPTRPKDGEDFSRFTQTVDLTTYSSIIDSRTAWLNVSGEMITCPFLLTEGEITTNRVERYDDADMAITFISTVGTRTDRHISKRRDTLSWYPFADVIPIPPGTRSVEIALTSYKRIDYVGGIDSGFDNIYVSVREWPIHGVTGGNLLGIGMDENTATNTDDATVDNQGWIVRTTGTPLSLNGFPPASVSGTRYLFAGDEIGLNPVDEPMVLSQGIDLSQYIEQIDAENLTLRWGGWTRTNTAEGAVVSLSLQLLDGRGDVWGEVAGRTVWESEWIRQEHRTRIPRGIRAVRFVMRAEIPVFTKFLGIEGLELQDDAVFADELFVRPVLNNEGI